VGGPRLVKCSVLVPKRLLDPDALGLLLGDSPEPLPLTHLCHSTKTAKALGLDLPASVLTSADEVIEQPQLCSRTLLHMLRSGIGTDATCRRAPPTSGY